MQEIMTRGYVRQTSLKFQLPCTHEFTSSKHIVPPPPPPPHAFPQGLRVNAGVKTLQPPFLISVTTNGKASVPLQHYLPLHPLKTASHTTRG